MDVAHELFQVKKAYNGFGKESFHIDCRPKVGTYSLFEIVLFLRLASIAR